MALHESLITPTANPELEQQLRAQLVRRVPPAGGFGQLTEVAVRLGLVQRSATPRFRDPSLILFAADHGLAVDGVGQTWRCPTSERAMLALQSRLSSAMLARLHGLQLQVVDCGMADDLPYHPKLWVRKVAHGSRNARMGPAMSKEQMQSALRVGMELAEAHPGNAMALAAIGQGATEVGALLLSRLEALPLERLLHPYTDPGVHQALNLALSRHPVGMDPLDALATLGGHDIAVMVGAMMVAASKQHLVLVDGMAACAALRVAASLAPPVTDYVLFCRSSDDPGLDAALASFRAGALLELGMNTLDGNGACLAWPLVRSAAALLADGYDLPGSRP
ncbi:nicotinate-nucleotide--dimethylbenzimidazole phosphoribosyltransferase [Inhella crocodyli]|uniref:Nicotinate-nucleotide--dimethylbenzimidazole phosphoribosyltransferase n=1 Tax=Inhella crocodyli TaxID=2499851 RepID=A0A437LLX2_9BURK|nr:nicotinate-nucleotide--dimethylbenzimidazole phosphoribosyltransferase [Inhella crocodyli]RVT86321.1 nicotinate-nucleotide--dimethylbenzimidazole phosphoribosyltransferase [Inhella crocodyli]